MTKQVTINQFLSDDEIKRAFKCKTTTEIRDEIILPNIEKINKKLGQENDPMYLAYLVEYVIRMSDPNHPINL